MAKKNSTPEVYIPKGDYIDNFTEYETVKNNPNNRCSVYNGGKHCIEEVNEAIRRGVTMTEIVKSTGIINKNIKSIEKNGYINLIPIPVIEITPTERYYLDQHHITRAALEFMRRTGRTLGFKVVIYKADEKFTLEYASRLMALMNKDGATPWEFIDIMRATSTERSKKFLDLYTKYNGQLAIAIIADATLNKQTTTKRGEIDNNWGADAQTSVWGYADEYLDMLTKVNITRDNKQVKISQVGSDAFRYVFSKAVDHKVLDMFKDAFTSGDIEVKFAINGRPNFNQWLAKFVGILATNKPSSYKTASAYWKKHYNQFLAEVTARVDYKSLCEDYTKVA